MKNLIKRAFLFFEERRSLLKIILCIVSVLLVAAVTKIRFAEDISKFLPTSKSDEKVNQAFQRFSSSNRVMVYFSMPDTSVSPDFSLLERATDTFAAHLRSVDSLNLTDEIFVKADGDRVFETMNFVLENLPYYLEKEGYKRIDSLWSDSAMAQVMASNLSLMYSQMSGFMQEVVVRDPLRLSNPVLRKLNELRPSDGENMRDGYLLDKDGKAIMVPITSQTPSSETRQNKIWLASIDETARYVMETHHVAVTYIGPAAISIGNAEQIKWDSIWTTAVALTLIVVLLFAFYRDWRAILLILFSISFGLLFAMAFLALSQDNVSVIAVGIGSIIVGIAVNYPLHFLAHIKDGHTRSEAINDIVEPLVTGNITTVGAFLSLLFISSDAMRDMGLFAALLLVGTIFFVMFFLPHLFAGSLFKGNKRRELMFGKVAGFELEKSRVAVALILLMTIPLCYFSLKPTFETNMGAINYMTPDQRARMAKLTEETESDQAKSFCVVEGATLDEALNHYETASLRLDSLQRSGLISKVSGISIFFPSREKQAESVALWNEYWRSHPDAVARIQKSAVESGFSAEAFAPFYAMVNKNYEVAEEGHFDALMRQVAKNYVMEEDGNWFVYAILEHPSEQTDQVMAALNGVDDHLFSFDGRSLLNRLVDSLSDDFNRVLYICGCIVFLFLLVSFGRVELAMLSFVPLTVAWIWILGLMGLFDMKFNIVNVILATFIFGQGDDYTIFVTEGLMHEYAYGKRVLASYKNSVMLSALIMFIGIGVLIFAKHPAMHSLAEVTIVGMFSVILMAYFFPPLLFNWLTKAKGKARLMPITLRNLLLTIVSFLVFFLGTIYLTLLGFFVLTIGGKSESHKRFYHRRLCEVFRLLVKLMPGVPCHVDNPDKEDFERPGIIICNHQSHLDLLYTLMLSPKIVCLTNKWVWNCPFYGWIIRYADFLPVSDGLEQHEEELKQALDRGYSILIFPEGTRSADCSILRFHKGAFHLAEKFGVDIIPLMIHGIGHFFPKQEFLLRKGRADVKVLPRITPEHPFRKEVRSLKCAQLTQHYYEKEYEAMVKEIETPDYFKDLVYHNYIYKGREVEQRAKAALATLGQMKERIAVLPDEGETRIEESGQGEFSLLAALTKKHLLIVAEVADEEQLLLAEQCASKPENLRFERKKSTNEAV